MRIPRGPSDLTSTWLTLALRRSGILRSDAVANLTSVAEVGEDRGFTGRVFRLTLDEPISLEDGATARTLIAKLPLAARAGQSAGVAATWPPTPTSEGHLARSAREIHFYLDLAPVSGVAVPHCLFAAMVAADERMVLLLEDLSADRFGDVLTGCSRGDAALGLASIARLHGTWWQRPLPMPWLAGWTDDHDDAQVRLERNIARLPDHVVATFPDDIGELLRRLAGGAYRSVLTTLGEVPRTLIHGDLHLDNIAFRDDAPETLPIITDWQTVGVGPAVVDLAAFLTGALGATHRRDQETTLLTAWHEALLATGVSDYSRDRLERDYGLALIRQLAGIFGWLANTDLSSLAGRERDVTLAAIGDGRLIAALRDHDPLALLV
jgi:hypothetical protein